MAFRLSLFICAYLLSTTSFVQGASLSQADRELCKIRPDLCDAPIASPTPSKKSKTGACRTVGKRYSSAASKLPICKTATVRTPTTNKDLKRPIVHKPSNSFAAYFRANSNHPGMFNSSVKSTAFAIHHRAPASTPSQTTAPPTPAPPTDKAPVAIKEQVTNDGDSSSSEYNHYDQDSGD